MSSKNNQYHFHTDTCMSEGLVDVIKAIELESGIQSEIKMVILGDMAVHLYTASRSTVKVNADFDKKILISKEIIVEKVFEDGANGLIYFDKTYNSSFDLMHDHYMKDSIPVGLAMKHINVHVLSPVDLVLSKLSRFSKNDIDDIKSLLTHGFTTADAIENRADEALAGYIGNQTIVLLNLRYVLEMANEIECSKLKK